MVISNITHGIFGSKKIAFCDIALDSAYPTGGEGLTPGNLGLERIEFAIIPNKNGYMFEYDYTNKKIKALTPRAEITDSLAASVDSGATPVTSSAANGSIVTLTGAAGVAAGAGAEVANATDLSSVTSVKAMFIGS